MTNLFAAAGVDLPSAGGKRTGSGISRSLRQPLFAYKVLEEAINLDLALFSPTAEQRAIANAYARKARSAAFLKQNEVAVRPIFIKDILEGLLGYTSLDPGQPHTLAFEHPVRKGAVDIALGNFGADGGGIVAPLEIKGPGTADLDAIMPGRGRSPPRLSKSGC